MPKLFENEKEGRLDPRVRRFLTPKKILFAQGDIANMASLLREKSGQVSLSVSDGVVCRMHNDIADPDLPHAALVLDFGREICGSVKVNLYLVSSDLGEEVSLLVRLGESVTEAMTPVGTKGACNDHALRESVIHVGSRNAPATQESGFRFAYIELLDNTATVRVESIEAIFCYRDLDYVGSFTCSDDKLNRIYETAAYTAHLCMQTYLWDGIKRDRLVWAGDLFVEAETVMSVFGAQSILPETLDLLREQCPVGADGTPEWMNGIPTYSIWWILLQASWFEHYGNRDYLQKQRSYLRALAQKLLGCITTDAEGAGVENTPGWRFLDWQNSENPEAIHAGIQALLVMGLEKCASLLSELGDGDASANCLAEVGHLRLHHPDPAGSKQAAALLLLAGLGDEKELSSLIAEGGAAGYSTFFSYHLLSALAEAGKTDAALDAVRTYYGAMLDRGATTFWEDFNLDWLEGSGRIDEIPINGKKDLHGDYGDYCYRGFRHSLCHGWSSGPCPWMMKYILGVNVLSPRVVVVKPHLGDLSFAQGSFPTPYGQIRISLRRARDGKILPEIDAPQQIKILCETDLAEGKARTGF